MNLKRRLKKLEILKGGLKKLMVLFKKQDEDIYLHEETKNEYTEVEVLKLKDNLKNKVLIVPWVA